MGAGKMAKSGVNNTLLKQRNRGLILKLIATGQCSSRIELSQKTGLAKMTVTYIVNEFLERGIFEERQKVQVEGKGRNPARASFEKTPSFVFSSPLSRSSLCSFFEKILNSPIIVRYLMICMGPGRLGGCALQKYKKLLTVKKLFVIRRKIAYFFAKKSLI